ncbi:MAG: mandelate racemase/muconate lactonizing enzyme family protein [Candidatus Dormibacter sp.]
MGAAMGCRPAPVSGLELIPIRRPAAGAFRESVLVIRSEGRLQGLGEAPVTAGRSGSLAELLAELEGESTPGPAARCGLQTAELDLAARRRGVPLTELLGGPRRNRVECTALVTAEAPDRVVAEVESWASLGFAAFKLKSAGRALETDLERLGAARFAAGASARLRLDFNGSLSWLEASERLRALAGFQLELIEQPLGAAAPPSDWAHLRSQSHLPLAADESLADPDFAAALLSLGVLPAVKLATVGGPQRALALAAGSRCGATLGSSFESSIGLAAALHVACALEREPLACGLATDWLGGSELAAGLDWEGPHLLLPSRSGLGVELDRAALERYRP